MGIEDKTREIILKGEYGNRIVIKVIAPLTLEESRVMFPYRPQRYSESRWCGNGHMDDTALQLNGFAKRCKMCQAPTLNKYLNQDSQCPDCSGQAEYSGMDPRKR